MLVARRASRKVPRVVSFRGNATLQSTPAEPSSPSPPPPVTLASPASTTKGKKPKEEDFGEDEEPKKREPYRFWPTTRPSISLERPRQYSRPIGVGILPVYDLALEYIKRDSRLRTAELETYKLQVEKVVKEDKGAEEIERLTEKVRILEIQSEINLPSVRWKAKNGLADMSKPVYRHLVEQRWREEGDLDLLMERIHQMNVVPDLLPSLHPSLDLRINFPEAPPKDTTLRSRTKRKYEKVEPGVFLVPEQTRKPPMMYTTVFHTDTRLYTLLMVDLDVPDLENESFQSYLHWLQPNIPLSYTSTNINLSSTHTKYIAPHPQRGSPYHRYVLLLVPQTGSERIKVPEIAEEERLGFNYRQFAETHGLDGSNGGAAHMWREVWDETVSQIYRETLKMEEPVFGRMPKADPYKEMKQVKKYI